jgi:hypothetical protein
MKKHLLFILLTIYGTHIFSQTHNDTNVSEKMNYLAKSKNQKTAALVMIIGGAVTTTIGVAVALSGGLDQATRSPDADKGQTLASILIISGSAAILGSIPFYIAANKNRKKAMSLALIIEKTPAIWFKSSVTCQSYPAIGLRLPLSKDK